jgi:hypothetical protein
MEKIMLQMFEGMLKLFVSTILIVVAGTLLVYGDENNNVSGDNTLISGGYTSSSSTTYQSGSSSNTTSTNTTNNTSNIKSFPPTASAPPTSNSGIDTCNLGSSFGLQSSIIGISGSTNEIDVTCERIKLARELSTVHNMKVAGIAVLCADARVFSAMEMAGTPCPFEGKIGDEAERLWQKYDILRPDYDEYIKNQELKEKVQAEQVMYSKGK